MKLRSMIWLLPVCMLPGAALSAETACNPETPAFTVNSKAQWNGRTATDIFNGFDKVEDADAGLSDREKILLLDVVRDQGDSGTMILKNCTGNALSIKLVDLYEADRAVSGYYLALTKKGTLKLLKFRGEDRKDDTVLRHLGQITLVKTP